MAREDFIGFELKGPDQAVLHCRVSVEALDDFAAKRGMPQTDPREIYRNFHREIHLVAERKYCNKETEPDGSVSVLTDDLTG